MRKKEGGGRRTEKFQGIHWQRRWELSLIVAHMVAGDVTRFTVEFWFEPQTSGENADERAADKFFGRLAR